MRTGLAAAALSLTVLLTGCTVAPAPTESAAPTQRATTTPLTAVRAGDCYDDVDGDAVDIVDCASRHGFEVFASLRLADGDYRRRTIGSEAEARCRDAFGRFVGLEFDASALGLRYVAPSAATWAQGDREVLCVVFDPTDATVGSLAAAAR